ncbi:unnamed protein product, partial [Didymodactylos carnosus]
RLASLYRVRKRSIGPNQVQLIFKGNPQEFQSFNKLPLKIFVGDTDYLIGKCVYDNDDGSNIRERYIPMEAVTIKNENQTEISALQSPEWFKTSNGRMRGRVNLKPSELFKRSNSRHANAKTKNADRKYSGHGAGGELLTGCMENDINMQH